MGFTTLTRPNAPKAKAAKRTDFKVSSITSRLHVSSDNLWSKQHGQQTSCTKKPRVVSNDNVTVIVSRSYSASSLSATASNRGKGNAISAEPQNPSEYLDSFVSSYRGPQELENFFVEQRSDEVGYDAEVIAAIRNQDIDTLRKMHQSGRSLQCSNKFGESLLHMACRRGFVQVVDFLLHEAGVSIRIRDDYGRTPLHDACWTIEPNFELMEMLIQEAPQLLWVRDKRNDSPLRYARREHWAGWNAFLKAQKTNIIRAIATSSH